jgi:tetratricopeptide (TPR) repeat protein
MAVVPCVAQLREREEKPPELPPHMEDEDDDVLKNTEYAFNPIQAQKEVNIGDFYSRKGSHRAAAARYLEATKWNPSYAEAFWKLAQAREKLNESAQALEAYQKYVELEPASKQAKDARKKIADLEKKVKKEESSRSGSS